jgi:hypothetical protein
MKMKLAPSHQKDKAGESSQKLSNNFTELFKSKKRNQIYQGNKNFNDKSSLINL